MLQRLPEDLMKVFSFFFFLFSFFFPFDSETVLFFLSNDCIYMGKR